MLRDIYVPTDLGSLDRAPSKTADEKLAIIKNSPVMVERQLSDNINYFKLGLPFIDGALVSLIPSRQTLHIDHFNLGDKALYQHQIGTRLLQATVRFGLERRPDTTRLTCLHARLGLLNTIVKVLGEDNVAITVNDDSYGRGHDKPLEALFDDVPPLKGKRYVIDAVIEPEPVTDWELPEFPPSS